MRWHLLASAKARGKTLDEYMLDASGHATWTRWKQIHEEIAFDILEAKLSGIGAESSPEDQPKT
jgi:hypothetical protein